MNARADSWGKGIFIGHDGNTFIIGDRVELSPATDQWMQGARFGLVIGVSPAGHPLVRLDKITDRTFNVAQSLLRRLA